MTLARTPDPHPKAGRDTEVELFSVTGHDGYLREVNDRFARLLGMEATELNCRSVLELVHPDDVGSIVAGLAALEAGAPEVMLENRFKRQDDGWIHLQWVARPLPGTDLWWAAGRDTTDDLRPIFAALDGVEASLAPRDALHDDSRVLISPDGHSFLRFGRCRRLRHGFPSADPCRAAASGR